MMSREWCREVEKVNLDWIEGLWVEEIKVGWVEEWVKSESQWEME